MEKSQKKKKKKNFFKGTFSLAVFIFPVIKRGKKVWVGKTECVWVSDVFA